MEVGRTAEVGAMTEEGVQADEPKRISGESGEYRRRTKLCNWNRTGLSSPLAKADDQD